MNGTAAPGSLVTGTVVAATGHTLIASADAAATVGSGGARSAPAELAPGDSA